MDQTLWITCPGCSGEIGVPPQWPADVVACPKCGAVVRIDERMRVLWRPKSEGAPIVEPIVRTQWIACHGCEGEIGVPDDWLGPTIACPNCGSIVAMRETGTVLYRPPKSRAAPNSAPQASEDSSRSPPAGNRDRRSGSLGLTTARGSRQWQPQGSNSWKKPAGVLILTVGALAFVCSAVVAGRGDVGAGLVAGLLNPFFFVGVPLGAYWLRHATSMPRRCIKQATVTTGPNVTFRAFRVASLHSFLVDAFVVNFASLAVALVWGAILYGATENSALAASGSAATFLLVSTGILFGGRRMRALLVWFEVVVIVLAEAYCLVAQTGLDWTGKAAITAALLPAAAWLWRRFCR